MKEKKIDIEGKPLKRDMSSKGLCSCDEAGLRKYNERVSLYKKVKMQGQEINKLQNEIRELKELIQNVASS